MQLMFVVTRTVTAEKEIESDLNQYTEKTNIFWDRKPHDALVSQWTTGQSVSIYISVIHTAYTLYIQQKVTKCSPLRIGEVR